MNKRKIRDTIIETKEELAKEIEKVLRYNEAIDIWEELRKLIENLGKKFYL